MKTISIKKTFVVNLDDKIHRYDLFRNLPNVERQRAVDSRHNWFVHEDYKLSLNPCGRNTIQYFTQSKGAVGCYLSHYEIWSKVLANNYEWTLILEDDASIHDAERYVSNYIEVEDDTDLIQLNDRTQHGDLQNYFNGTTAYLLNQRAAKILFDSTHEFSHFNENPSELLEWRINKHNLYTCSYIYDNESRTECLRTPNSIRVAVDKHIGYNSFYSLPSDKRIKIKFDPRIEIYETNIKSDVSGNEKPFYEMNCEELAQLENRKDFKWWETPNEFKKSI
jgi:GR25 family glycosyltransferase involved in LPS biosynthesis